MGVWWGEEDEAISRVEIYSGSSGCDGSDKGEVMEGCCGDEQLLGVIDKSPASTPDFGAEGDLGIEGGACVSGE